MPSLLDVAERSQKGPRMEESDWDMALFHKMTELAKRYEIACPDDPPWFNMDDDIPERAFRASVDFLAEMGVYCVSTGRIIKFTEKEVLEAVRAQPPRVPVGEGRDQRVIEKRPLEYRGEFNLLPGLHTPFSEEYAPLVVQSLARLPEASYVEGFNFTVVDGREIFGMPMEAYAAQRQIAWMREGVRKAERPGMAIAYYPINTRGAVLTAPLDPERGLRRSDGVLLSTLQEIKVEHDLLTAAIIYHDYGAFKVNATIGRFGSFVGGREGGILESIITAIAGWMVYRIDFGYVGVNNAIPTRGKPLQLDRKTSWAASVGSQALVRFTNYPTFGVQFPPRSSGPGTETSLLVSAAEAVACRPNGSNLGRYRHGRPLMNAGQTPVEVGFKVEVCRAADGPLATREAASRVMDGIARLLDGRASEPPKPIFECYDLVNLRPSPEYREIYLRIKDQIAGLGVDFD